MSLKERIIEATLEEFNEKGLKFTMEQLARRVGISKKTLYLEFEDKETLLLEAIENCFREIKASEDAIYSHPHMSLVHKIRAIIIVLPEKYRTVNFTHLYGLEEKSPRIYKQIADKLEKDWEKTLALLEEAMEKGYIRRVSLTVLQTMITATIEAFIRGNSFVKDELTYTEALEEMMDIIMAGICTEEGRHV